MKRHAPWFSHRKDVRRKPVPKVPRPAAGVLLTHVDADGVEWVMLGLRARELGGGWSNLGGSLHAGENPLVGALRELQEETRFPVAVLRGATITHVLECGTTDRPYTLFVFSCPTMATGGILNWEHRRLAWCRLTAVSQLRLYPKFGAAWIAWLDARNAS